MLTTVHKNRLQVFADNLRKFKERTDDRKGYLKLGNTYSFNGVGNQTYMELSGDGKWKGEDVFYTEGTGSWSNFLCPEAVTFFGFSQDTTIRIDETSLQSLFEKGSSFKHLALLIEEFISR